MSIVPILRAREVIRILFKAGFKIIRQSGSHLILRHITNPLRQTIVPIHTTEIPRGILGKILKQAKISVGELLKLLK